ncbi:MAG: alpha/beta hydrolase [Lachnospiraceae bacterium]|nr:alpha/beta hydrolase [Lachnospiraceae bacterium]
MNEIEIKEIKIPFQQWETDGILYTPKKEGKFPVVVFSHGYNGFKMDFDETAKYLAERGVASLCYTFCGGSTRDVSGMPTTDIFQGEGHGFSPEGNRVMTEMVYEFVTANLK